MTDLGRFDQFGSTSAEWPESGASLSSGYAPTDRPGPGRPSLALNWCCWPEGAIRGRCHGRLQQAKRGHSAASMTFSGWKELGRLRGRRSAISHDRKIMVWKTQALCATLRLE